MTARPTYLERSAQRFEEKLRQRQREGTLLFVKAKAVAVLLIMLFIAGWFLFKPSAMPSRVAYVPVLGAFLVLQAVQFYLLRGGRNSSWTPYLFVFLEMATVALALLGPNPFFFQAELPLQANLRFNNVLPMVILVAGTALAYSPLLVLWAGFCAVASWSAGVAFIYSLPDTTTSLGAPPGVFDDPTLFLAFVFHYTHLDVFAWFRDVVLLLLVSGILAAAVWRTRRFIHDHATAERQRGNLARYFSPNVVDELAASDSFLHEARQHDVAILFADIVGYTRLTETMTPDRVMAFLRDYHGRMEEEVFRFGGTLDKFVGDAIMASFGAPWQGERDAANALECARAMVASIAAWNRERVESGEPQIQIGIGLHYGPAVMGDVGSDRCAAFSVVGDTTNTTSRLEALTRDLGVAVVASQQILDAVRREAAHSDGLLDGFVDAGTRTIRGREAEIRVWTLGMEMVAPAGSA